MTPYTHESHTEKDIRCAWKWPYTRVHCLTHMYTHIEFYCTHTRGHSLTHMYTYMYLFYCTYTHRYHSIKKESTPTHVVTLNTLHTCMYTNVCILLHSIPYTRGPSLAPYTHTHTHTHPTHVVTLWHPEHLHVHTCMYSTKPTHGIKKKSDSIHT